MDLYIDGAVFMVVGVFVYIFTWVSINLANLKLKITKKSDFCMEQFFFDFRYLWFPDRPIFMVVFSQLLKSNMYKPLNADLLVLTAIYEFTISIKVYHSGRPVLGRRLANSMLAQNECSTRANCKTSF